MNIKKVSLEDIDDLVGLFDQYMVFYEQPSNPEKYRQYLIDRLSNNDAVVYLAADADNQPAGFVLNYQSFSSVSQGRVVILNDLFVAPASRKSGIAEQLIACSVELAKAVGALRVELHTAKDNYAAQALYEKLDFVKDTAFYAYSLAV